MQVVRQQLRELSITSQSRPASTRPSITLPPGPSPLSITGSGPPSGLNHFSKANSPSALSPNKASLAQPHSPWKLGPGAIPPLHPTSPARVPGLSLPPSPNSLPTGAPTCPGQRTSPGKGGLRWGAKWGKGRSPGGRSPGQGGPDSPIVQSTDPSRNWGSGWGSPLVQSRSPSRDWGGSGGTPPVHSSSPSHHWVAAGGDSGVQSSSPSRFCDGAATPPVQSSAPSFLKGWLQKQRGHSVVEEQAMEVSSTHSLVTLASCTSAPACTRHNAHPSCCTLHTKQCLLCGASETDLQAKLLQAHQVDGFHPDTMFQMLPFIHGA